jgi:hypothetical protein
VELSDYERVLREMNEFMYEAMENRENIEILDYEIEYFPANHVKTISIICQYENTKFNVRFYKMLNRNEDWKLDMLDENLRRNADFFMNHPKTRLLFVVE